MNIDYSQIFKLEQLQKFQAFFSTQMPEKATNKTCRWHFLKPRRKTFFRAFRKSLRSQKEFQLFSDSFSSSTFNCSVFTVNAGVNETTYTIQFDIKPVSLRVLQSGIKLKMESAETQSTNPTEKRTKDFKPKNAEKWDSLFFFFLAFLFDPKEMMCSIKQEWQGGYFQTKQSRYHGAERGSSEAVTVSKASAILEENRGFRLLLSFQCILGTFAINTPLSLGIINFGPGTVSQFGLLTFFPQSLQGEPN